MRAPISTLGALYSAGIRPCFADGSFPRSLPRLPDELTGFDRFDGTVLEFRLSAPNGPIDLSWSQLRGTFDVPPALAERDPWRAIRRFGERWQAGDPVFECVKVVFFELDQAGDALGLSPAIFFHRVKSSNEAILTAHGAIASLFGRIPSPSIENRLAIVLHEMPQGAVPLGFGFMLSRVQASLRFEVMHVGPPPVLQAYLRRLGWQGDTALVMRILAELPRTLAICDIVLAVDVGAGIGHRLGIALMLNKSHQASAVEHALSELIGLRLAVPADRALVERWTSSSRHLPEWLRTVAPTPDIHRGFSHFKLVFDGSKVEAKAYLECAWRTATPVGARAVAPAGPAP